MLHFIEVMIDDVINDKGKTLIAVKSNRGNVTPGINFVRLRRLSLVTKMTEENVVQVSVLRVMSYRQEIDRLHQGSTGALETDTKDIVLIKEQLSFAEPHILLLATLNSD